MTRNARITRRKFIQAASAAGAACTIVPRRVLGDIVEPRIEELFSEVRRRMEESGLIDQLSAGMVLTGLGSVAPASSSSMGAMLSVP